jgi:hypothetical protein
MRSRARVPGFPHLRVDRLLAQLAPLIDAVREARAWRAALAALDEADRRFELANAGSDAGPAAESLAACRQRLARADHNELPALLAAARVPDDYSTIQRALGLYPLTRYAFAAGIRRWQQATLAEFAAQATADPGDPRRLRYVAAAAPERLPALRNLPELGSAGDFAGAARPPDRSPCAAPGDRNGERRRSPGRARLAA